MSVIEPRPFTLGPALLFCPADQPERYTKAAERADAVILDLEDAVAPGAKAAAREALLAHPLDPERTVVRINPMGSPEFELDLKAIRRSAYRTVMLAKAELDAGTVIASRLHPGLKDFSVIALLETALGVTQAQMLARLPEVVALMWGAEDLVASLGGSSSRTAEGQYRAVAQQARSQVLLAAGAFGKAAIDAVYLDLSDLPGLAAEADDAAASGFTAKACIHPAQVAVIRSSYAPSEEQIAAAREVLAADAASATGVFQLNGRMVDAPILRQAEQILRRAAAAQS
ncbi:HpcH/HpaI aldolase/citrate lyase family protein [Psychromicrobium xiongbiense]|uniref:HpcH/HpaI aldolase/citrate lyase family protein n=1 Tax=Psychromicrobium xiongbiense TaxID=3051184 RepID=UPI002555D129|nr:CoA ester lyase [Psychromicrobium sp. YIM S02556]